LIAYFLYSKCSSKYLFCTLVNINIQYLYLLGYAPETAGRIMTPEYINLKRSVTIEQALQKIRAKKNEAETLYVLYKDVTYVATSTDQEELARLFKDRDLLAVPVVDSEDRLVGIVTVDHAIDILEKETTEDMLKKTGVGSFIYKREEGRSSKLIFGNLWHSWQVRLPFLVVTLIGGLLAGVVIDAFEETLETVVAPAIFIPVIMDMGGNKAARLQAAEGLIIVRAVVDKARAAGSNDLTGCP